MNSHRIASRLRARAGAAIVLMSAQCLALAGTTGGLERATTEATNIKSALFTFVGVCALIYLLVMGLMAFLEKKSWADFGWAVVWVAIVGASGVIGTWAWNLFTT